VTDSRHTLTTNLTIHVVDPLDSVGESSSNEPFELSVKENVAGALVANLRTLLNDVATNFPGRDTRFTEFILANFEARDKFAISNDGAIYTLRALDREKQSRYFIDTRWCSSSNISARFYSVLETFRHLLTVISQNRGIGQGQGIVHAKKS